MDPRQIASAFLLTIGICLFALFCYNYVLETTHIPSVSVDNSYDGLGFQFQRSKVSINHKRGGLSKELLRQLGEALPNATEKFSIIIWDPPFGAKGDPKVDSEQCGQCDVSYDKNKSTDPNTKAIIFHFNEVNIQKLPSKRRADQFYVWWTMESTRALKDLRRMSLKEYDGGVFNLTMTYRQDSDIYSPYQLAPDILKNVQSKITQNKSEDLDNILKSKDNLALWIVSNCGSTKGAKDRLRLSQDLVDVGLRLDRRGGCFPKQEPAPRSQHAELIRKAKFYMSFENNHHCKDYITEKFLVNGLMHGAVPVVWGGKKSDYIKIAPPNSFIFVEDFATSKELVDYLNYLDKNDTAYKEYLSWRHMQVKDMPNYGRKTGLCQLCRILHGINIDNVFRDNYDPNSSDIPLFGLETPRIVPSLANWFYGYEYRTCALGI